MRIVHLISGLGEGGAETTLWRLLRRMDPERFSNHVVCLREEGPLAARIRAAGVPVDALGIRAGSVSVNGAYRLTRFLRERRPAVLQTWLYHADLAGLVAGTLAGLRCIVWNVRCADMDLTQYRRMSTLTVRACARLSHLPRAVVVNSEAGQRHHQKLGYQPRQWIRIPNGVDVDAFRPDPEARASVRSELQLKSNAVLVGLIGRFDPIKDHATFFRAAAIVAGTDERAHFVLAGAGVDDSNRDLASLAQEAELGGRAHCLGSRSDIPRITAALDVAVSSSVSEGLSNVLVEAMACGVPCVATDVGDSRFILGDTGAIVPPRDAPALAAAITETLRRALGGEMSAAARRRAREEFDLALMVRRYEDLYSSLALDRPRSAPVGRVA